MPHNGIIDLQYIILTTWKHLLMIKNTSERKQTTKTINFQYISFLPLFYEVGLSDHRRNLVQQVGWNLT